MGDIIKLLFLIPLFFSYSLLADDSLCKFFKYCGGGGSGSSRSSAQSLPSSGSAAGINPSNISKVKGLGLESIYQAHNHLLFNIVTGNGKLGALVSPNQENSFFGNRSIEIDEQYLFRRMNKIQYDNKKLNFALGYNIREKKNVSLDIGLSIKRNPDIKKLNLGLGVSGKFSIFNLGIYTYADDIRFGLGNYVNPYTGVAYSTYYNSSIYSESFTVTTFTSGINLGQFTFDFGVIKTKYAFYPEATQVNLYSASYNYKKFLFNFARRMEHSSNQEMFEGQLRVNRSKFEDYYGIQFLANKHLLLGVAYNQFLLHEFSGALTLFF